MKRNKLLSIFVAILLSGTLFANNLKITDLTVTSTGAEFKISWDNSWYFSDAPNNWDAAWIFIKSYDCEPINKKWEHVKLSTDDNDHSAGGLLTVNAVTDGMGVFVRRTNTGTGDISSTTVNVKFDQTYNVSSINFKVMGIEMVAVLQGAFKTGGNTGYEDNGTATNALHSFSVVDITSEAQIPANTLTTETSGATPTTTWEQYHPTIPASFPKGYDKFYIMKYPISQEQYASFLNLLTYAQQSTRTSSTPTQAVKYNALATANSNVYNRNSVKIMVPSTGSPVPAEYGCDLNNDGVFNDIDDGQNLACNFLMWDDLLAYLDWSGLRPMTELEYEKACRGSLSPIADEFAWGNANITQARSNDLTNSGEGSEISNASGTLPPGNGLAAYGYTAGGPLRVGFPAMAGTDRVAAGASYWGVMELSGNVYEQTMGVGGKNNYLSTSFTGQLGDGELSISGTYDQTGWNSYQYSVLRGGSFYTSNSYARVASRFYGYYSVTSSMPNRLRSNEVGGRGVRQF